MLTLLRLPLTPHCCRLAPHQLPPSSAICSGINQSTIDNIVRGLTRNPRAMTLHKIALAFGMTLSEFLDFPELNDYSFDEQSDE